MWSAMVRGQKTTGSVGAQRDRWSISSNPVPANRADRLPKSRKESIPLAGQLLSAAYSNRDPDASNAGAGLRKNPDDEGDRHILLPRLRKMSQSPTVAEKMAERRGWQLENSTKVPAAL
jgi:hypothetical protein